MKIIKNIVLTFCLITNVNANQTISNNNFTVTTNDRFGGAVSSIKYHGIELIDKSDNGRLLQSAVSYDNLGEYCNPTQGGDVSNKLTSITKFNIKIDNKIITVSDMSYWLKPQCDEKLNTLLTETQIISPYTILSTVTYSIPSDYTQATFEALTGYMKPKLKNSIFFNPITSESINTNTFIGEQQFPVIHYTDDKTIAVGVFSNKLPQMWDDNLIGYGRFYYSFDPVTKFNCVFRETNLKQYESRTFQCMTVIGSLNEVKNELIRLHKLYK